MIYILGQPSQPSPAQPSPAQPPHSILGFGKNSTKNCHDTSSRAAERGTGSGGFLLGKNVPVFLRKSVNSDVMISLQKCNLWKLSLLSAAVQNIFVPRSCSLVPVPVREVHTLGFNAAVRSDFPATEKALKLLPKHSFRIMIPRPPKQNLLLKVILLVTLPTVANFHLKPSH